MNGKLSWAFIVWSSHGRRSESLARALGASLHFIYASKKNGVHSPLFRYVTQSFRTLKLLFKERPQVVFVQTPPFVCSLVAYLYCTVAHAHFVLDHHTASFGHTWDWALGFQKFVARHAMTNIVTGQYWMNVLHSWGADAFILVDPLPKHEKIEVFEVDSHFTIACVNTFAPDEPLDAILEAAAQLPDVYFYITGNTKKRPESFFAGLPSNVIFTHFLPDAQYFGLLQSAHAVMTLTTRNYTLQCGGFEAMSLGKPLITSDWSYLRELFPKGTIYVANSGEGIRDGIREMQEKYQVLGDEMLLLRDDTRREWERAFTQLRQLIVKCQ